MAESNGPNWTLAAVGAAMVVYPEPATTATGIAVMGYGLLDDGEGE